MFEELYERFEVPDPADKTKPLKLGNSKHTASNVYEWLDEYTFEHPVPITNVQLHHGRLKLPSGQRKHNWVSFELVKDVPSPKTGKLLRRRTTYILDPTHNVLRDVTKATSSIVLMPSKSRFAKLYLPEP